MNFTIFAREGEPSELGLHDSYDSLEDASQALRRALGWSEIWLGPGYTTSDGENQIWRAFKSRAESESGSDGLSASAPRITRSIGELTPVPAEP